MGVERAAAAHTGPRSERMAPHAGASDPRHRRWSAHTAQDRRAGQRPGVRGSALSFQAMAAATAAQHQARTSNPACYHARCCTNTQATLQPSSRLRAPSTGADNSIGVDTCCASSSKRKSPRAERCGAPACCLTPRRGRSTNFMCRTGVLRHGSHATSPASPSAPGHAAQQRSVPIPVNPFRFPCAPTL